MRVLLQIRIVVGMQNDTEKDLERNVFLGTIERERVKLQGRWFGR